MTADFTVFALAAAYVVVEIAKLIAANVKDKRAKAMPPASRRAGNAPVPPVPSPPLAAEEPQP